MKIWIFQTGEPIPTDKNNPRAMRAINLLNSLRNTDAVVTLISTRFNHIEKLHRTSFNQESLWYTQVLIDSPGYKKNIGISRLIDHYVLAIRLWVFLLKVENKPDVVFIGYPPIETAYVLSRWLVKLNIPYIIDIKDQWPSIFLNKFKDSLRPLVLFLLTPQFYMGRYAMMNADSVCTISESFLKWVYRFSGRAENNFDFVAPLSTKYEAIDHEANVCYKTISLLENDGVVPIMNLLFVGSHTDAFDMECLATALKTVDRSNMNFNLIICGSGPCTEAWKSLFLGMDNIFFPGWVSKSDIQHFARDCVATLAPYRNTDDFDASVPNKIIDSLALGLPIISSLRGDVKNIIEQHKVGFTYSNDDPSSLVEILLTKMSKYVLSEMSASARLLYKNDYDCDLVYAKIVESLLCAAVRNDVQ